MDKQRRKKVLYIPGIISLIILPIIFFIWTKKIINAKTVSVIPIVFADTNFLKKQSEIFKEYDNNFPPKRNYIDIDFTGNNRDDKTKLDFAQIRIREFVKTKDYKNGIHFSFGDSSEYWTFVKTVDILRLEGAKTFMPLDKDLWFFNLKPDMTLINTIPYSCMLCDDVIIIEPQVTWLTKTKEKIRVMIKTSWTIIVAFVSFLFLVILIQRKKNGRQH